MTEIDETLLNRHLGALRQRIMHLCGIRNPQRVKFEQDDYGADQDGGVFWTIVVLVPPDDKRQKHDDRVRGSGETLAEAEAEFADRWKAHCQVVADEAARRKGARKR